MGDTKKIKSFTDLIAWKEGHNLVLKIYELTKLFPKEELFGLVGQMRRCAVSITSNIAEGFSRHSYNDKAHFYSISLGSITELQNQLIIARDIKYIEKSICNDVYEQSIKVHKIINGLIKNSRIIHNS
ncbi:MAG TPA: four helix bundle protein [Candidatus Paceibacterota bacterium]|nr:four helix bundle protein [Candidatus Paceibacterota bacterium]